MLGVKEVNKLFVTFIVLPDSFVLVGLLQIDY